jgi:hypothetical protein
MSVCGECVGVGVTCLNFYLIACLNWAAVPSLGILVLIAVTHYA